MSIAARLAKAEAAIPKSRDAAREYLARCFAGEEYAEHRERIIDALLSDYPQYSFHSGDSWYLCMWWLRDQGRRPGVKSIHRHSNGSPGMGPPVVRQLPAGYLTPPTVRQYPGVFGEEV